MGVVVDKLLGKPLLHEHPLRVVSSDPSSAKSGSMIYNSADHKIKIYVESTWHDLHTLTIPDKLLLESGDYMLLESGDRILLEG